LSQSASFRLAFPPDGALGTRMMALIEDLARFTDVPGQLTRLYLSPAHKQAALRVREMMEQAGMSARLDALGNVQGRYEGTDIAAPALIIGSHIDTVVDGGRHDGNLGVVAGIALVEELKRAHVRLPFAVEVVAFGDEENVRFPTNLSTSQALAGAYDPRWLDARDENGTSLREALVAFGGDPGAIAALARQPGSVIGYLEMHIEQGPVLELENLPVGVVTAINGITRGMVQVTGEAGHAGTVPMALRRDAVAAAAEMILAIETIAAKVPDAVATVGQIVAQPGAINVIAGGCRFSLDFRSPVDEVRARLDAQIEAAIAEIATRRGVSTTLARSMDSPATAMDTGLRKALAGAIARHQLPVLELSSGAGHDAVAMARIAPSAMLFVRCEKGISHNPAEAITAADADAAGRVLLQTVLDLAVA
jgi:allantoate deiminase